MIIANILVFTYVIVVGYVFITYYDRKFHVSLDIARDLANAETR